MEDNHKPLINKDATDYTELYALHVLQEKFPYKYIRLHHSDRPDVYDEYQSVGIEVTEAINPQMAAAMNNWNLSFYEDNEQKKNQRREAMKKYGEMFQNGPQLWKHNPCSTADILNAISNKIEKFQNYDSCNIVDLFVGTFGNHCLVDYDDELANFGNDIILNLRKLDVKYRYVYIDTIGFIYRFDIENSTYMIYPFSTNDAVRIGDIARKEIFDSKE